MPESIVPQAQAILALTEQVKTVHQSPFQKMWGLPKHTPQALVSALVQAAEVLAIEAEYKARQLALSEKQVKQLQKSLGLPDEAEMVAQWEAQIAAWEAEEDGRLFLETCALEHSFQDILR